MRIIVGIDPGSTAGIACIDANSTTKKIETQSKRNFSFSKIVEWISQRGEPIIIATDKAKPPSLARRLAATFGARLASPKQDMKQTEKAMLSKGFETKNDHEQDALAVALWAKQEIATTLEKVEREVQKEKQGIIKKMLITGKAANIETAVEMLADRKIPGKGKERKKEKDRAFARLFAELEQARERNKALEKELLSLKMELQERKYERNEGAIIKKLRQSHAAIMKEKEESIQKLEKLAEGEYVIVEPYEEGRDFKGKAVLLEVADEKAIREIEKSGAVAIITDRQISSIVPVIGKAKANIRQLGKFLVIDKKELKEELAAGNFAEWLDAYKENRKAAVQE